MNAEDADQGAIELCRAYANSGVAAFLIRTHEPDSVRIIGPHLTKSAVASMLRNAADAYELQADEDTFN